LEEILILLEEQSNSIRKELHQESKRRRLTGELGKEARYIT